MITQTLLMHGAARIGCSANRRGARYLCAFVLLGTATACSSLQPLPGVGLGRTDEEWLGRVRVSLHDGTELVMRDASITPDSIIGLGGATRTRLAVARADVAEVETRHKEVFSSFLIGMVATVVGFFALLPAWAN